MQLSGSCHCGAVHFTVESHTLYPFMRCYCSICRKTAGGGGFAINIMGEAKTLKVKGKKDVTVYRAILKSTPDEKTTQSSGRRYFCKHCGSALWISDPNWPQWIYPFASAIDTPLPKPPETVNLMLNYAANWCDIPRGKKHLHYAEYPNVSIKGWHKKHGLIIK